MNIAVFASHSGSDLQAIIDGCKNDKINATVLKLNCHSIDCSHAFNKSFILSITLTVIWFHQIFHTWETVTISSVVRTSLTLVWQIIFFDFFATFLFPP